MARLAAILLLVGGAHALELALSTTSTSPPTHTHTHNLLKWTSPSSSRPLHAREPPLGSPRMSALPLPVRTPPPVAHGPPVRAVATAAARIDDRADTDAAAAERLTVVGAGVNVVLSATKAVAGTAAHSPAMLADAAHSLSDLLSDGITLWAVRASVSRKTGYISIGDLKLPLLSLKAMLPASDSRSSVRCLGSHSSSHSSQSRSHSTSH